MLYPSYLHLYETGELAERAARQAIPADYPRRSEETREVIERPSEGLLQAHGLRPVGQGACKRSDPRAAARGLGGISPRRIRSLHKFLHFFLGNQPGRLIKLRAQPAHD